MIKAIPTIYNGVEYRSRLEAQVACLLTNLGADFQYEPQGFDLGDGLKYLPDFFVTNNCAYEDTPEWKHEKMMIFGGEIGPKQFWIEVKGNFANKERDEEKVLKFAGVGGGIPNCDTCEFNNAEDCFGCEPYHSIENPILVIDELPKLENLNNLESFFENKSKKTAIGANEIHPWCFDYLVEYFYSSANDYYFKEKILCPCINIKGEFCLAPSDLYGVDTDWGTTILAYKKALEVGKWSPSPRVIPTAIYSKSTLELFAKKAREMALAGEF